MADITIQLPWSHPALLPNNKEKWSKAKQVKLQRWSAKVLTMEALNGKRLPKNIFKCVVHSVFYPPTGRGAGRDEDNCHAALKSAFDGIADALGVNDKIFSHTMDTSDKVEGGVIFITVRIFTKDRELK